MHNGSAHVGGISLWKGVLFLIFFCSAKGSCTTVESVAALDVSGSDYSM